MDELFGALFGFLIYALPLIGAVYTLSRALMNQISDFRNPTPQQKLGVNPYLKISFTIIGILYGLFLLPIVILSIFKPTWFHPPMWVMALFIILFVPYLACVWGFCYGLGYLGHGGVSPSRTFGNLFKMVSKSKDSSWEDPEDENKAIKSG